MIRILAGGILVLTARWTWRELDSFGLTGSLLMIGISLILHFGFCNLLVSAWRRFGVEANVLFLAPLYSQSLSEFWARRWNLAFLHSERV